MWEPAESVLAITGREFGEALGRDRERMRRNLSEIRQVMAGGEKMVAETRALIAVADALTTIAYCGHQKSIEVSKSAPAALPNGPLAGRVALREVSGCFGVVPNFFCSASAAPGLIEEPWAFAKSAYIGSPLPPLFKERLFAHLSRFCEVRYCIIRHVGILIGEGRPGDPKVRPETIEQVIRLLQRPVPDANGKSITILIPVERQDEERTILKLIRRGHRIEHYETVRQRKDGSLVDISLTVSPVKAEGGEITGASKIGRDITERKRSKAQMSILAREAEHRAKSLLGNLTAMVQLSTG
jgi:hypothetical protein